MASQGLQQSRARAHRRLLQDRFGRERCECAELCKNAVRTSVTSVTNVTLVTLVRLRERDRRDTPYKGVTSVTPRLSRLFCHSPS